MAELKTQPNSASVKKFLDAIEDEQKRKDCYAVKKLMEKATGSRAKMWGDNIVGFGKYHYKYASGREGDWFKAGFAPRKQNLTLYIMGGFRHYESLTKKLGKHKRGKACLYIKRLEDIDEAVLNQLIEASVEHISKGV